ncbi:hypothetical protein [Paenibacillus methanolicus]|uniref:Uncharacterized protein n=1 Tax=Paenibacillus methanolicus TaxID=582686 RepID=A0A5S5BNI3_9BACL|nr:hypothetical protein [Paenibacillus methanolicus]TYP67712.1 hypothetical protein BCM02_12337 [Paenibacillus methanolicus]
MERKLPDPKSPFLPAEHEVELVKEQLVLRAMQDLLNHEIKHLQAAPKIRMTNLYVRQLDTFMDRIIKAQYINRRTIKEAGIKVLDIERVKSGGGGLKTCYLKRGYEYEFRMLGDYLRAECEVYLSTMLRIDLNDDRRLKEEIERMEEREESL